MKLPNGYGSVVHLTGKRRNPYWVRKTVGWTDKGYPKYFTVGYTKTRTEGLALLAKYNHDPWTDSHNTTLKQLFAKWKEDRMPLLSPSNAEKISFAHNHAKDLDDYKYREIKAYQMQAVINTCGKGYATQQAIKAFWRHMDKYAFEMDIITKQYSELLTSAPEEDSNRMPFTESEIYKLWTDYYNGVPDVDIPLIFIYTGFRISELQHMKVDDIDWNEEVLIGGIKTAAGKNRRVPIHHSIKALIEHRAKINREGFLFESRNGMYKSRFFREKFKSVMNSVNMEHVPHECRHTFETLLDNAGANRKCIDMMMGHVSKDIGNRVYNHKTLEQLKENIELLPTPEMLGVSDKLVTKGA